MCYLQVNVLFDFQEETALKNSSRIGKALEPALQQEWQLSEDAGTPPQQAWEAALRRGQRSVWLALTHTSGFEITLSIVTRDWRRLYLTASRNPMLHPEAVTALLGIGSFLYQGLGPDYGWGLVAMDTQLPPLPQTGDFALTTLHDFNFLSPRLVRKLGGLAVLRATPAPLLQPFADGGALLSVSTAPLHQPKQQAEVYMATAAVLGLPRIEQGC